MAPLKHQALIERMKLEDKVALCSGANNFYTKAFQAYGIPSLLMTDGPHGIRKTTGDTDIPGSTPSVPATCFPAACLSACSWDRGLLYELGAALAEEAQQEGVSIILGPGVNLKRNPLCGRNFEYFSEDPFLAGELATGWIQGVQSRGVGVSLKHFAANSQENHRNTCDSLVDERTLREIYLPAFEKVVKEANPATVMCAYNRVNGVYCSDHNELLRKILREEWGFEGVVVSDWGAINDRVQASEAGLDLEMPFSGGFFDSAVIQAIQQHNLAEARLDESVDRLLALIFTASQNRKTGVRYDPAAHHRLAQKIASSSAVLLKNEGHLLPLSQKGGGKIALIGAMAKEPRYQGAGSSLVCPTQLSSAVEGFEAMGLNPVYYPGYTRSGEKSDGLIEEAAAGARQCETVILFVGLPEACESEGFDRVDMHLPASHTELIRRVADANPRSVVVLSGGAPVEMPWLPRVKAVLNLYLAGQAGGLAVAELLTGAVNPSGKLAESYPLSYSDVPSAGFYEAGVRQAQYREGIYVGYRYYDKAKKEVCFPFGHGLSYTEFEYSRLELSQAEIQAGEDLAVSVTLRNVGPVEGGEVVQLYVGEGQPAVFRPEKELKGFEKVFLKAGESRQVQFRLDFRAFACYDPGSGGWIVPDGIYRIAVGASSRDLRLQEHVTVHGTPRTAVPGAPADWYACPAGHPTQADFEALLGHPIEPPKIARRGEFDLSSSPQDMDESVFIRVMLHFVERTIAKEFGGADDSNPNFRLAMETARTSPMKNLVATSSGRFPLNIAQGLVELANGHYLNGLKFLLQKAR